MGLIQSMQIHCEYVLFHPHANAIAMIVHYFQMSQIRPALGEEGALAFEGLVAGFDDQVRVVESRPVGGHRDPVADPSGVGLRHLAEFDQSRQFVGHASEESLDTGVVGFLHPDGRRRPGGGDRGDPCRDRPVAEDPDLRCVLRSGGCVFCHVRCGSVLPRGRARFQPPTSDGALDFQPGGPSAEGTTLFCRGPDDGRRFETLAMFGGQGFELRRDLGLDGHNF